MQESVALHIIGLRIDPAPIAQRSRGRIVDLLHCLGFPTSRTPCQSTLHRLFRQLDARALSAALRVAFDCPEQRERGEHGVAIDGKAQRGRLRFESGGSVVHALAAFCQEQGVVLTEEPSEPGPDQAEAAGALRDHEPATPDRDPPAPAGLAARRMGEHLRSKRKA